MPTTDDIREIGDDIRKRRIGKRDWDRVAEFVMDIYSGRSQRRGDREKQWKEIDRQLAMTPSIRHKLLSDGRPDVRKAWMPEMELPLQAETLEVLTADARRMMFPDAGNWFAAHAMMTDDLLERIESMALVAGDRNEVPSQIDQDNIDKIVEGVFGHWHHQYDFRGHVDLINADAFKYGVGIGRMRMVRKPTIGSARAGGVSSTTEFPALVPRSIKHVYLDDSDIALMNEGYSIGQSVIYAERRLLEDLRLVASKGNTDPNHPNGGWMPSNLRSLERPDDGYVDLVEYEGDLVVPRTGNSLYVPGAIVTIVQCSHKGVASRAVIRFRLRPDWMVAGSWLPFVYHREDQGLPYATSPLMKGRPVAAAAADALNRVIEAAALSTDPPIGYDGDDQNFAARGGPMTHPGARWPSTGEVKTYDIGNPMAMWQVYVGLLQQYSDVTGVNAPRLGAQTLSHTTAYAKEAELSRGTVRTVDYVRTALDGPMSSYLSLAWEMGRRSFSTSPTPIYLGGTYRAFVNVKRSILPERAVFEAHGSGGPAEERQKRADRMAALQMALQIDQLAVARGEQPSVNVPALIEQLLREGGWQDVDAFLSDAIGAGAGGAAGMGGLNGGAPGGGAPGAALQALLAAGGITQ